jgi:prolyl-tRNA editing enzyme YbaK/EbsC (Cys-tRNA(Pro) deacylase)
MESSRKFSQSLDELQHKVKTQSAAAEELGLILAQCAKTLLQHDQINRLNDLRVRITQEVEHIGMMENAASARASRGKLIAGLVGFAVGSIAAAATSRKSPLLVGADVAKSAMDEKSPFGKIMIVIGKHGLPDDVQVVPVSRLARESNTTEMQVTQTLQKGGCFLLNPDTFDRLLDNIGRKILDGSMSLPVSNEEPTRELQRALPLFPTGL